MNLFQYAILLFLIGTSFKIVFFRKKESFLKEVYLYRWLLYSVVIGLFVTFPALSTFLSRLFGIQRGVDLVIYVAIIFLLYKQVQQAAYIQKLESKLDALNRSVALKLEKSSEKDFPNTKN